MAAQNKNSLSLRTLIPAGACLAAGVFVLMLLSGGSLPEGDGNFADRAAQAHQARIAVLLLISLVGAVVTYQLGVIADRLPANGD